MKLLSRKTIVTLMTASALTVTPLVVPTTIVSLPAATAGTSPEDTYDNLTKDYKNFLDLYNEIKIPDTEAIAGLKKTFSEYDNNPRKFIGDYTPALDALDLAKTSAVDATKHLHVAQNFLSLAEAKKEEDIELANKKMKEAIDELEAAYKAKTKVNKQIASAKELHKSIQAHRDSCKDSYDPGPDADKEGSSKAKESKNGKKPSGSSGTRYTYDKSGKMVGCQKNSTYIMGNVMKVIGIITAVVSVIGTIIRLATSVLAPKRK